MAAPTSNAKLRKLLANGGPSTHGAKADWRLSGFDSAKPNDGNWWIADRQLAAFVVVTGNGKNWVVLRRSTFGRRHI